MAFHARATVLGKLVDDPKIDYGPAGKDAAKNLARTEFHIYAKQEARSRAGEKLTIRVVMFGLAAEIVAQQRKKGDHMLVAGRLLSRIFAGKDGVRRHHVFMVAEDFSFVPQPPGRFIRDHVLVTKLDRDRWIRIEEEFGAEYMRKKHAGLLGPDALDDEEEDAWAPGGRYSGPNHPSL